jgi:N-acetylmuramic acid 6-phosphate etherase
LIMLRLGRVYHGQMVDMVARNEKLRRRAVRMVRGLTGCTEDAACCALTQAGGRTKLAVLLVHGIDADEAASRLAQCDGHLGAALRVGG